MRVALVGKRYGEGLPDNRAWAVITEDGKIYPFGSDDDSSLEVARDVIGHVLAGHYDLEDFLEWIGAEEITV